MACGNARCEAYTAGGEATLLSLEILNVDVLVLIIAGAALEAPLQARRNGSSGVKERPHSHGMARRGTWEAVRHEGAQEGASPPCSRAAQEMGDGPPEPPCRRRLQTAHRCCV